MSSEENHTKDAECTVDPSTEGSNATRQINDNKCTDPNTTSQNSSNSTPAHNAPHALTNGFAENNDHTSGVDALEDVELSTPRASSEQNKQEQDSGASPEPINVSGAAPEMVEFKVVYGKQTFNVVFPVDSTVLMLKEHIQQLTDVEVRNQKIMYKGLMKDELTLADHKLTAGSKVMVVGSKSTDIQSVNQTSAQVSKDDKSATALNKEPLCQQKAHKTVLDKYGKPDDVMPGIKNCKESLPSVPLSGMYNKVGSKVRLTFKLEADQVWIGTKERTEKVGLSSIKAIVSEPIDGHEEYHLLGIQLGPTEASRYWIYWVPAQYVDSIKDTVLGNWQYF